MVSESPSSSGNTLEKLFFSSSFFKIVAPNDVQEASRQVAASTCALPGGDRQRASSGRRNTDCTSFTRNLFTNQNEMPIVEVKKCVSPCGSCRATGTQRRCSGLMRARSADNTG